jgi:5-methylcytosine-specific restriction endonuclease McrA
MATKPQSQKEFVMEWFKKHPNRDIPSSEFKQAIESAYEKKYKKRFEDVDRQIRRLNQDGFLIKVRKGVFKYVPGAEHQRQLEDFTEAQRKQVLERDGYKCVICGLGREQGLDLQVDHIKPKELGGKADISNGQTLCAKHNFMKKISSQTETGKKMFIRLLEASRASDEPNKEELVAFCEDILLVFERHGINGHIEWKK